MDIKTNTISSLPASAFTALIATGLLFISIPLLTKISTIKSERKEVHHVLINPRKPAPPRFWRPLRRTTQEMTAGGRSLICLHGAGG